VTGSKGAKAKNTQRCRKTQSTKKARIHKNRTHPKSIKKQTRLNRVGKPQPETAEIQIIKSNGFKAAGLPGP